jgi:hypothetical protein
VLCGGKENPAPAHVDKNERMIPKKPRLPPARGSEPIVGKDRPQAECQARKTIRANRIAR